MNWDERNETIRKIRKHIKSTESLYFSPLESIKIINSLHIRISHLLNGNWRKFCFPFFKKKKNVFLPKILYLRCADSFILFYCFVYLQHIILASIHMHFWKYVGHWAQTTCLFPIKIKLIFFCSLLLCCFFVPEKKETFYKKLHFGYNTLKPYKGDTSVSLTP